MKRQKKPTDNERSDPKGGADSARPSRGDRHSGSGAASALASLKNIERKREEATPREPRNGK
jgi:hypothetical protein